MHTNACFNSSARDQLLVPVLYQREQQLSKQKQKEHTHAKKGLLPYVAKYPRS